MKKEIIIYQSKNGALEFKGDFKKETIWASLQQIADLFGVERSFITKHIKNIFSDEELDEKVVSAKFAHAAVVGKRYQNKNLNSTITKMGMNREVTVAKNATVQWGRRKLIYENTGTI
ncbi:MAG: hypothetical protein KKC21_07415 [Nitrospinae bacterium]|nr:hypothetical protein [Nitrospinota bacterium]